MSLADDLFDAFKIVYRVPAGAAHDKDTFLRAFADVFGTYVEPVGGGGGGTPSFNRHAVSDANYNILATDDLIVMTSISVARTFTLPSAASAGTGKKFLIKDESGSVDSTKKITVGSTDLIDGVASIDVTMPYAGLEVYSNGSSYFSI